MVMVIVTGVVVVGLLGDHVTSTVPTAFAVPALARAARSRTRVLNPSASAARTPEL
jgi:hypothetical protein